jgi:hypothetical protein
MYYRRERSSLPQNMTLYVDILAELNPNLTVVWEESQLQGLAQFCPGLVINSVSPESGTEVQTDLARWTKSVISPILHHI